MATYQGTCKCQQCSKPASVYTDKNGFAYYKCGPCGFYPKQTNSRFNQAFLKTIERDGDPDAAPSASPESSAAPIDQQAAARGDVPRKAGFFDGVLS